jgi:hypothetical protein
MKNELIANAFVDELEKIAGLPRAVRQGGGGAVGKALRVVHSAGRDAAERIAMGRKRSGITRKDVFKRPTGHYFEGVKRQSLPAYGPEVVKKDQVDSIRARIKDGVNHAKLTREAVKKLPPQGTPRGKQLRTWAGGTSLYPDPKLTRTHWW